MDNLKLLLVQNDLKKIVNFSEKCINAGVDENSIYATVYAEDIDKFVKSKEINTVIIDSELYNLNSASILRSYAQEKKLKVLLVTSAFTKKTIRMLMDKNLEYIHCEIDSKSLAEILGLNKRVYFKKAVHM